MPAPPVSLALKPDMDDAIRHWLAFWNKDIIDRPCCVIRSPREGAPAVPAPRYMAGAKKDLDAVAEQALAWAESIFWGGDAVPSYTPSFGPDQMAAWLGADLKFHRDEYGTSWAVPCIDDWNEALPLRLDPDNHWWRRMLSFCTALRNTMRGRMAVTHLDLHSNMDTLLAMRGAQRLCMDLIDSPDIIDRAMESVRALYVPIYQALYDAAGMAETGVSGWVPAYHPARTNTIQCDFAALIGPEHFRRWAMPALEEEAAFLGHCVYHFDGPECLVHLNDICSIPGLDCIQWTTGARNKPFIEWLDLLKAIQAKGVSVWVPCTPHDICVYHRELKPNLLFYDCWARSQKEAEETLKWLVSNT